MSKNICQKIERCEVSICQTCIHCLVCRAIDNQPCTECNHYQNAADVAPVRHGRWIFDHMTGNWSYYSHCSECGHKEFFANDSVEKRHRYCYSCGALMDGKENDHAVN